MVTIEYFRIEIKPWYYTHPHIFKFEIAVQVNGERYYQEKMVRRDDLNSMLDMLFNQAKAEIKKAISDQQEKAQSL